MLERRSSWAQWRAFLTVSGLGPIILLLVLMSVEQSGLVAVPSLLFAGAGALLVFVPLRSLRARRVSAGKPGGGAVPLPPWKQMLAAYSAVLLLFVALLLATA